MTERLVIKAIFAVKRYLKAVYKIMVRELFEQAQRFGFDVPSRHFYSEIPYIHRLKTFSVLASTIFNDGGWGSGYPAPSCFR
jgi:hypothetical protein